MPDNVRKLFLAILVVSVALCQTAQKGTISGTVIDAQGQPVAGINVRAVDVDESTVKAINWETTDSEGKFSIVGLGAGRYRLITKGEAAGYPNTTWALFDPNPTYVSLTSDSGSASIVIKLAPKAAVLTGSITDAVTGVPVKDAGFEMWRPGGDLRHSLLGGSVKAPYKLLLPADTRVSFAFRAPGYQAWYYPGVSQASDATSLTLKPGQEQTVDVLLQPLPTSVR
jgi:hypothetical protein